MKRAFFLLAILLSGLSGAFFPSAAPVRAADAICLCYHSGQDCDATNPFTGNASDCTTFCKGYYGIEYVRDVWQDDSSTFTADTDLRACQAAKVDANASTVASATVSSRTISYATPELSVPIPGIDFSVPYLKNGNITSNFLATYVAGMYTFLISVAMTIAIVMIMVGGVQYVVGSTTGEIGKAKDRIMNAVTGFVLLLFVYVILFVANPNLVLFSDLSILAVPEIPLENLIEPSDADSTTQTSSGAALVGKNKWQDCMISHFGASAADVKLVSVPFDYLGHKRTYKFNEQGAADLQKAFDAIKSSGVNYDITRDSSGGTFSWRANKNNPAVLSAHSWGTAIDINPDKNPNCPSACFDGNAATACNCVGSNSCQAICESRHGDLPQAVIDAFINNGFDWLGDRQTSTRPNVMQDYMHFTWSGMCPGG